MTSAALHTYLFQDKFRTVRFMIAKNPENICPPASHNPSAKYNEYFWEGVKKNHKITEGIGQQSNQIVARK